MFQRILVPTDFSASAEAALRLARREFPDAVVCLLHVIDPKVVAAALRSPIGARDEREVLEAQALERLAEHATAGDEVRVVIGSAVESVVAAAEAWRADLIVMGTHGRTGIDHFLNGSVAERVVRFSNRPVLIEHERVAGD